MEPGSQQPHPHCHLASHRCDFSTVVGSRHLPGPASFLQVKLRHEQRPKHLRSSHEVQGRVRCRGHSRAERMRQGGVIVQLPE